MHTGSGGRLGLQLGLPPLRHMLKQRLLVDVDAKRRLFILSIWTCDVSREDLSCNCQRHAMPAPHQQT